MTNVKKIERFIKSEIFTLEDFNNAYRPGREKHVNQWVIGSLRNYGLKLCKQGGRYYVGLTDGNLTWDWIAALMSTYVGHSDFVDNIIVYMDIVLENEKPKPKLDISYDLDAVLPGDTIIYETDNGSINSVSHMVNETGEIGQTYINYFKARPFVIIKNARGLLVKP